MSFLDISVAALLVLALLEELGDEHVQVVVLKLYSVLFEKSLVGLQLRGGSGEVYQLFVQRSGLVAQHRGGQVRDTVIGGVHSLAFEGVVALRKVSDQFVIAGTAFAEEILL